ncbi:peptidoglycan metallopeptidase Pgp5 [Campylobacter helveticus]|uniref:M23 family metallopeptidase n=1 Tax=Campylobacter helveticus TaxID=28898 RepID=A0AAX2UJC5_9BACT|nr:peptidoglycan DD-metalloendopeptidase family protein [Campylobacter helveticus]ARE79876.1 zinc metallopeptidase, M23 family [Campylobacter helveticus]MCR2040023.1 peptidoglycan DD-metalloendopeptidase family protein [Campylobacter helveticus]MCR2055618.1 peptidoglycan DD-metalloendopeptidase family protein [Campylobacter helveticus]MCR2057172.1 peptidoglycan DD-metalloendopeptidase family protein [Campylobacter helveticus]MCR2061042.1 peptidoglycan DD-metalloendopeptidase family protein [Ca
MKKIITLLILFNSFVFGYSSVEERLWDNGDTLLQFLQRNSIPIALYYNLDREDQELASEIASRTKYQILKDGNGHIEQVLIPISDELQIHIYKSKDGYKLTFTPVDYTKEERVLRIEVKNTAYQDVYEESQSSTLARAMVRAFKGSVNFRSIQKGDKITLYYSQKRREGKLWGDITIHMAIVEINKNAQEIFLFNDTYYGRDGKELESFLLAKPVVYKRISSYFTTARFHPVLKRYRAHLGVDYAAPTGTPVKSSGNGTVTFIGTQGGYGKVIKIKHASGYTTLYAHLSRFAKIKTGQKVKQGELIGYVGSTGMSTGPHLHFGVYLNNKAINPLSVVKIAKSELSAQAKAEFRQKISAYEEAMNKISTNPPKEEEFGNYIEF